ncbi:hypothetical protein BDZ97DRAFT_1762532 [Flammula alnicola]|nr:hypothetical protein BDZ97DRAFT_1762532 [Flammula alnicola]
MSRSPRMSERAPNSPAEHGFEARAGTATSHSTGASLRGVDTPTPQARAGSESSRQPSDEMMGSQFEAPSLMSHHTGTIRTSEIPERRHAPRADANELMRRYGMGTNVPIAQMDTLLAEKLMLFWEDFTEIQVPTNRCSELVSEALSSTILARSARSMPPGNPNDEDYVLSVMKRVGLTVKFYMNMMRRNVTKDRNQHIPTPENYLEMFEMNMRAAARARRYKFTRLFRGRLLIILLIYL